MKKAGGRVVCVVLASCCWAIDDDGYLSAIRFGSSFWDLPEPELMFELALVCKTLLPMLPDLSPEDLKRVMKLAEHYGLL